MLVKEEPCLKPSQASMMKLFYIRQLKAFSYVQLGSKYASENTGTFKIKLKLAKSS